MNLLPPNEVPGFDVFGQIKLCTITFRGYRCVSISIRSFLLSMCGFSRGVLN